MKEFFPKTYTENPLAQCYGRSEFFVEWLFVFLKTYLIWASNLRGVSWFKSSQTRIISNLKMALKIDEWKISLILYPIWLTPHELWWGFSLSEIFFRKFWFHGTSSTSSFHTTTFNHLPIFRHWFVLYTRDVFFVFGRSN